MSMLANIHNKQQLLDLVKKTCCSDAHGLEQCPFLMLNLDGHLIWKDDCNINHGEALYSKLDQRTVTIQLPVSKFYLLILRQQYIISQKQWLNDFHKVCDLCDSIRIVVIEDDYDNSFNLDNIREFILSKLNRPKLEYEGDTSFIGFGTPQGSFTQRQVQRVIIRETNNVETWPIFSQHIKHVRLCHPIDKPVPLLKGDFSGLLSLTVHSPTRLDSVTSKELWDLFRTLNKTPELQLNELNAYPGQCCLEPDGMLYSEWEDFLQTNKTVLRMEMCAINHRRWETPDGNISKNKILLSMTVTLHDLCSLSFVCSYNGLSRRYTENIRIREQIAFRDRLAARIGAWKAVCCLIAWYRVNHSHVFRHSVLTLLQSIAGLSGVLESIAGLFGDYEDTARGTSLRDGFLSLRKQQFTDTKYFTSHLGPHDIRSIAPIDDKKKKRKSDRLSLSSSSPVYWDL